MSGAGSPQVVADGTGLRVAIVAASWHEELMNGLIDGARRGLADAKVAEPTLVRVPGSFELPVVAARALATHDAVVVLGIVVRGGTPHFDYVAGPVSFELARLSVQTGKPVGFGLLTCDTEQQARDRAGLPGSAEDKGYEAAVAAVATAVALRDLV